MTDKDGPPGYLLWTELRWSAAALQQNRARSSRLGDVSRGDPQPDGQGCHTPDAADGTANGPLLADVHFLMIAVNHLDKVLDDLGSGAPRLAKALSTKAVEVRHLLEHWWYAEQEKGAWKGYREKYGPYADPAQVQFDPGDLRIGMDPLSIVDLAADISRVERQLNEIEART